MRKKKGGRRETQTDRQRVRMRESKREGERKAYFKQKA